jgi:zinc D-Ala-D-Ala dipeptidase
VSAPLHVAGRTFLRYGLVDRLVTAQSLLPRDVRLLVVDGYRPPALPCRHPACAVEEAALAGRELSTEDLERLVGLCATPPAVASHPTGGAVDLTLSEEDLLLPACCAGPISPPPKRARKLLNSALGAVGFVNYAARWWHWSYGDRFWACVHQAPYARYGPLPGLPDGVTSG